MFNPSIQINIFRCVQLRKTCIDKSDFKKVEHTIHKPLYNAMHQKPQQPNRF